MALKGGSTIWGCWKAEKVLLCGHVSGCGGGRKCGIGVNLGLKEENSWGKKKWECCSSVGVLGQRAITPVEDEKNQNSGLESSSAADSVQEDEAKVFHKDLSLLPSEFIPFKSKFSFLSSILMLRYHARRNCSG